MLKVMIQMIPMDARDQVGMIPMTPILLDTILVEEKVQVVMILTIQMLLDMIQMIPMVARVQVAVIPMIPIQLQERVPEVLILTILIVVIIQMIPMDARVQVVMILIQIQEKAPMARIQIVHLEKAPNMTLKIPNLT